VWDGGRQPSAPGPPVPIRALQLRGHISQPAAPGYEGMLEEAMAQWGSTDHEALEAWLAASPYYAPGRENSFQGLHRPMQQVLGVLRDAGLASKPASITGTLTPREGSFSSVVMQQQQQQQQAAGYLAIAVGSRSFESSLAASIASSVFDDDAASQVSSAVGRVGLPHLAHQVLKRRAMLTIQPESKQQPACLPARPPTRLPGLV
jgi:hypothetical protein